MPVILSENLPTFPIPFTGHAWHFTFPVHASCFYGEQKRPDIVREKFVRSGLSVPDPLYQALRTVIHSARTQAYRSVNRAMVEAYWHIGRLIVEEEQAGRSRAGYGVFPFRVLQNG